MSKSHLCQDRQSYTWKMEMFSALKTQNPQILLWRIGIMSQEPVSFAGLASFKSSNSAHMLVQCIIGRTAMFV